jgi:transketolase C-terminal domain/subunit
MMRAAYCDTLMGVAEKDSRVVLLDADLRRRRSGQYSARIIIGRF